MKFEVGSEDGRTATVEAADWMMALVRGVDRLGDRVTGFSCTASPSGEVLVEDHGNGRTWVVRPLGEGDEVFDRDPTPPPRDLQSTQGPHERRLMEPRRRLWQSGPPRPLWEPSAAPRAVATRDPRAAAPPNLSELLFELSLRMQATDSLVAACEVALSGALALVPAEGGSVLRGGEADNQLVFVAAQGGAGDQIVGKTVPWAMGIAGAACVGGVTIVVVDAQADPRHDASLDEELGFETRGLMAVPVRTESGFYGVIELLNPKGDSGFERWHVDVVESVASVLADRLSGRS